MGEIAEMMLDGTLDAETGEYLGDPCGYPRTARDMGPFRSRSASRRPKPRSKARSDAPIGTRSIRVELIEALSAALEHISGHSDPSVKFDADRAKAALNRALQQEAMKP